MRIPSLLFSALYFPCLVVAYTRGVASSAHCIAFRSTALFLAPCLTMPILPSPIKNKGRLEALQKEKEFYFQKLRDIELLIQTPGLSEMPVLRKIEEILYAPTQQEGHRILLEAQRTFAAEAEAEAQVRLPAGLGGVLRARCALRSCLDAFAHSPGCQVLRTNALSVTVAAGERRPSARRGGCRRVLRDHGCVSDFN